MWGKAYHGPAEMGAKPQTQPGSWGGRAGSWWGTGLGHASPGQGWCKKESQIGGHWKCPQGRPVLAVPCRQLLAPVLRKAGPAVPCFGDFLPCHSGSPLSSLLDLTNPLPTCSRPRHSGAAASHVIAVIGVNGATELGSACPWRSSPHPARALPWGMWSFYSYHVIIGLMPTVHRTENQ